MNFKGVDICCPHCRGDLALVDGDLAADGRLRCEACSRTYPVLLGIPDLRIFPDPYIDVAPDHAKGRQIAAAAADRGFPELIDYYYGITDVVPPRHAALYKRGLLAAEARAAAALAAWEAH
ncbi:MAG: hypothetical protein KC425_17230, partial [Anaerolineales bacterium]|nr:hypothetical protein [Anaerolineales bacterium]